MENEKQKEAGVPTPINRNVLVITYLIYVVFWESLVLGGAAYMITKFDRSGWWMLLALVCSCYCIRPKTWYSLWDGIDREKDED